MKELKTFEEFWPFYLSQHRRQATRALHYLGTTLVFLVLGAILISAKWSALPLVLVVGYGPAWIGHFFIEKNRPATFQYPVYSLLADFKMVGLAIFGRLGPELERK